MPTPPVTLTFDTLTLKMVSESCVTWATSVPILVFLGLSVLDLGPMYATDRRQTEMCGRPPQYAPTPCKLTFALLTLKVVSESRVTLATSVPTLVFLGLSVLDLTTDRRQTSDAHHRLMPSPYGGGHKNSYNCLHICQEVLVTIISLTKKDLLIHLMTWKKTKN